MIIRKFEPADLDDVLAIEYEAFPDPYPVDVIIQLHEHGAGFIVAEVGRHVVGYNIFWIKEGIGHIIALAVGSHFRDMQVGSLLLEKSISILESNNIFTVSLEVRKSNVRAINFYVKHGFVTIREEDNYYSDGENAFIMQYQKLIN